MNSSSQLTLQQRIERILSFRPKWTPARVAAELTIAGRPVTTEVSVKRWLRGQVRRTRSLQLVALERLEKRLFRAASASRNGDTPVEQDRPVSEPSVAISSL